MKIKQIELSGFKTFADKAVFSFAGGISCIVGPNGCGKSNLVDAFRWVLGEQSVKSLRSDRMEEVIFQGSSSKKQKGLAEVSLTILKMDDDGTESNEKTNRSVKNIRHKDEIIFTRRLYRSGESEYLLNRRQCRLKHLRDILLEAGIDPKSYSIFDHIRISEIINTKPHEKRFILEEIAGITKYKIKRVEAIAKLESSRQNLLRINDISYEIRRQLSSLERQVRKAERYKKLSDEMRDLELKIAKKHHSELIFDAKTFQVDIEKLVITESLKRAGYSTIENIIEVKRLEIISKEKDLSINEEELNEVIKVISQTEKNIAVLKTLIDNKNTDISRIKLQMQAAQIKKDDLKNKLAEITKNEELLKSKTEDILNDLKEVKNLLKEIELNLSEKESGLESKRKDIFKLADLISIKRNEYNKISSSMENLKYRESLSNKDMNSLKGSISSAEAAIQGLETSLAGMQDGLKKLQTEKESYQTYTAQLQQDMEDKKIILYKEKENIASNLASLKSLSELIAESSFKNIIPDGSGHLFKHALSDFIKVDSGYENAIEAAFSEKITAIVINNQEDLIAAVNIIKERNLDRTCFLYTGLKNGNGYNGDEAQFDPEGANKCQGAGNDYSDFEQVRKASDLVAFDANGDKTLSGNIIMSAKKAAGEILEGIYVANDLNTAIKIYNSKKSHHHKIVTLDGEVITPEGIIIIGKGKEILKRKNEIEELQKIITEQQVRLKYYEKTINELTESLLISKKTLSETENKILELQQALALHEQNLRNRKDDMLRKKKKIAFLETEIKSFSHEKESLNASLLVKDEEIKRLEFDKSESSKSLSSLQDSLISIRKEYGRTSEQINDFKLSLTSYRERLDALNKEKANISETISEIEMKDNEAKRELQSCDQKITNSSKEIEEFKVKMKIYLEKSDSIRTSKSIKKEDIQVIKMDMLQKESELKNIRSDLDMLSKKLSELKTKLVENKLKTENIEKMIMQKYSVSIDHYDIEEVDLNISDAETHLAQIYHKIQELGTVNLGTIEEFEELKDRYDFIVKQKQDIETSISELEETIGRIDNTTKKRLREAYLALKVKFSEIFTELFGEGGMADIVLTDENDILQSGIEIIAQPPGKKLQNLNLLSGGEKTLTTLAIMFAGFAIRPAPLCILDEVDAALDESNATRFAQMLRRFSSYTQFLVITHNRATMEAADFLYGITMEEPGISKVISLRFADFDKDGQNDFLPGESLP